LNGITVLVPSRARPSSILRLAEAFRDLSRAETWLNILVDDDDPKLDEYYDAYGYIENEIYPFVLLDTIPKGPPGIVHPVNLIAPRVSSSIVGFMGDDHIPRTEGWDTKIIEAFDGHPTIVYGDDKFQGQNLATAVFMSRSIIQTLGYMCPPDLKHLFVDNFWMDLGRGIGSLKYLPDVVIEHLHPLAGKGEWDETYEECNNPNAVPDRNAYARYKVLYLKRAIRDVKATL
jgi:hypothetical protein